MSPADDASPVDDAQPVHDARLGGRIRALRTERGMSLRALAADLGISPSALSQIERDRLRPSVTRLLQIMSALNVSLSAAFGETIPGETAARKPAAGENPTGEGAAECPPDAGDGVVVTRAETAAVLSLGDGVTYRSLTPVPLSGVQVYETVYPPDSTSSQNAEYLRHSGHEMGSVTAGRLTVDVDGVRHDLGPGDGIRFPSATPHRIRNEGDDTAVAVWINVP